MNKCVSNKKIIKSYVKSREQKITKGNRKVYKIMS